MPFSLGFARAKQDEPKRDDQRERRASKPHIVRKTPSTKLWEVTQAITVHTVMGAVEAQPGDLLISNEWGCFVGKGSSPNLEQMSDVPRGTRLSGALAGICMCLLMMGCSAHRATTTQHMTLKPRAHIAFVWPPGADKNVCDVLYISVDGQTGRQTVHCR